MQPGRRERVQIPRIGTERKEGPDRPWDDLNPS